jgi:hypothetical protein
MEDDAAMAPRYADRRRVDVTKLPDRGGALAGRHG